MHDDASMARYGKGSELCPGEGGIPIYGLYRYVPRDRIFKFLILKQGIIFATAGIVFPVRSLDWVPKFYQLKLQ